MIFHVI